MRAHDPQLKPPMHPHLMRNTRRGSALGATLVITLAITLMLAVIMRWTDTEQRFTRRHVMLAHARYATQSMTEHGAAQIRNALRKNALYSASAFSGSSGLALPGNALLQPPAPDSGVPRYVTTAVRLTAGNFNTARWEKVDTSLPFYDADPLADQQISAREVNIVAAATVTDSTFNDSITTYAEQTLQVRDSPLFGYTMFYNLDLEVWPGKDFDIYGPVHTNRNLYLMAENGIHAHLYGTVTAAGGVYHTVTPGSGRTPLNGNVSVVNAADNLVSLNQGGTWIDCLHAEWKEKASQLWEDNLRDSAHGITVADPAGIASYAPDNPATAGDELANNAHDLIEPSVDPASGSYPGNEVEVQKFSNQASLVLVVASDGTVRAYKYTADTAGTYYRPGMGGGARYRRDELAVPAGLIIGGSASNKFYDQRRAKWVNSADIDIGALKDALEKTNQYDRWTNPNTGVKFTPTSDWNGILYVHHKNTTHGGVRLTNAKKIPGLVTSLTGANGGLTIATNAPIYTWGHFNSTGAFPSNPKSMKSPESGEPPAAIVADAIIVLSGNWQDSKSGTGNLSDRVANDTVISAAILSGIVPTNWEGNGTYSGGVQTFTRFLENWNSAKFGYRGSLVCLFESEMATESWGSANCYKPPTRWWAFNSDFGNGKFPPGTPRSRTFRRVRYRDLSKAEYDAAVGGL